MYQCPNNPKHERFETTVTESHGWIIDQYGEFVEDLGCNYAGKVENLVTCAECQAEAEEVSDDTDCDGTDR